MLQELGGWELVEMVRRCAQLSGDHLAEHVDRLSGWNVMKEADVATIQLRAVQ